MVIREKFHGDLKELQSKLIKLGNFAGDALTKSLIALDKHDIDLSLQIIEDDAKADFLEEEINDLALLLLVKQQPVAIDLRRIIVAIKIASDIERIADFATNIAKSTIRIGKDPHIKPLEHIKNMHKLTLEMLKLSLESFDEEDVEKAKKVAEMDDKVDALYDDAIKELLKLNQKNQEYLPQITQLSFVCRYLERSADHITNIGEYVYYLVKGKRLDLNS